LSAEAALIEHSRRIVARTRGREPERLPLKDGYAPLLLDGVLPPTHPLYDSAEDIRRRKIAEEKRRRGLL